MEGGTILSSPNIWVLSGIWTFLLHIGSCRPRLWFSTLRSLSTVAVMAGTPRIYQSREIYPGILNRIFFTRESLHLLNTTVQPQQTPICLFYILRLKKLSAAPWNRLAFGKHCWEAGVMPKEWNCFEIRDQTKLEKKTGVVGCLWWGSQLEEHNSSRKLQRYAAA